MNSEKIRRVFGSLSSSVGVGGSGRVGAQAGGYRGTRARRSGWAGASSRAGARAHSGVRRRCSVGWGAGSEGVGPASRAAVRQSPQSHPSALQIAPHSSASAAHRQTRSASCWSSEDPFGPRRSPGSVATGTVPPHGVHVVPLRQPRSYAGLSVFLWSSSSSGPYQPAARPSSIHSAHSSSQGTHCCSTDLSLWLVVSLEHMCLH